jgi:hypothetical protein
VFSADAISHPRSASRPRTRQGAVRARLEQPALNGRHPSSPASTQRRPHRVHPRGTSEGPRIPIHRQRELQRTGRWPAVGQAPAYRSLGSGFAAHVGVLRCRCRSALRTIPRRNRTLRVKSTSRHARERVAQFTFGNYRRHSAVRAKSAVAERNWSAESSRTGNPTRT